MEPGLVKKGNCHVMMMMMNRMVLNCGHWSHSLTKACYPTMKIYHAGMPFEVSIKFINLFLCRIIPLLFCDETSPDLALRYLLPYMVFEHVHIVEKHPRF